MSALKKHLMMMEVNGITKKCNKCNEILSTKNFHKDKQKKDGLCVVCKKCKIKSTKKYYRNNLKKCKEQRIKYYEANKETINMNRRINKDVIGRGTFNKENPNHFDFGASLRKDVGVSSFNRLVRQYKANAAKRKLEFSIDVSLIKELTKTNCFYCGIEPLQKIGQSNGYYLYNGIDRKNKDIGYTKDNCVPCCKICNRAKSNMTEKEWMEWISRLFNNIGFKKTIEKDEVPKSLQP